MKKKILALLATFTLMSCSNAENNLISEFDQNINTFSKSDRNYDVLAMIQEANKVYQQRNPELVKLKYQAMRESPFAFYRSTAYLFYDYISKMSNLNSPLKFNIQGDLHLENIGTYKTSTGRVSYDFNDFDDSSVAPYSWDLARSAVSIILSSEEIGFKKSKFDNFIEDYFVHYYNYLENKPAGSYSSPADLREFTKPANKLIEEISGTPYSVIISKFVSGEKLKYSDKVKEINPELKKQIANGLQSAGLNIIPKDIGYYISGKGSLGRYRYIVYGESAKNKGESVIFELKEAVPPAVAKITGKRSTSEAQRVLQMAKYFVPDLSEYMGTVKINQIDYFIRKILPNERINLAKLDNSDDFKKHIKMVAYLTAHAHGKSGKVNAILNERKNIEKALIDFSLNYANVVKQDYKTFEKSDL